ncbi:MAG: hypothetical protein GYA15_08570 [Leptolinea sp.]|jgi:hypothetical protein|nr:hypothetical protein [Leptolinea sp.]
MNRNLWIGLFFLLIGIGSLFSNLGFFPLEGLIWPAFLAGGGLIFLFFFLSSRSNWWAAIPGCVLLSIGVTASLPWIAPGFEDRLGGPLVLAGISLGFWLVYLRVPANWWAIIPAGVMLTLASVTLLQTENGLEVAGVFFIGLGLTFALVALLPGGALRMAWPWIPAAIMLIMGFLFISSAYNLATYVLPAAMIVGGLVLILRAFGNR